MGDRRTNDRRIGDRRTEDRREPEKGVVKITIRNLIIYGIITIIITAFIVTLIYYIKDKIEEKNYEDNIYYSDNEEYLEEEDDYIESNYNCDVIIEGDKTELKAGETITYEIKAKNIDAEDGIVMFETIMDYDKDAFTCKVIDSDSEWHKTAIMDDYLTMARSDLTPNSEDQSIVKIQITAKEDIQQSEQIIIFSGIKFTMDDDKIFYVEDQVVPLTILEK